jgi:membrane associated rhomboid family serine protease
MIPAPVGHQCPECVQQAWREFQQGPGSRVRSATRGLTATKVLLGLMVVGYVLEVAAGGSNALTGGPPVPTLVDLGALVPAIATRSAHLIGGIAGGEYWRYLTSIFLHAGLMHIAFNAWALWIFGTAMENVLGTPRFLVVFFVTGFLAGATSYALGPIGVAGRIGPNEYVIGQVAVGASGAIFGVFGAFVAYNFRRRHLASAAANLRLAMTLILLNAMLAFAFGTIDWRAHVGGFVSGVAAGFLAEGFGSRGQRTAIAVAGFTALIAIGVIATMHRTAEIRTLLGI